MAGTERNDDRVNHQFVFALSIVPDVHVGPGDPLQTMKHTQAEESDGEKTRETASERVDPPH